MEGMEVAGKMLVFGGLVMTAMGGVLWLLARLPGVEQLPGTIRVARPGFTCVVPVVASILVSVVLTIVVNVILRFLNR